MRVVPPGSRDQDVPCVFSNRVREVLEQHIQHMPGVHQQEQVHPSLISSIFDVDIFNTQFTHFDLMQ